MYRLRFLKIPSIFGGSLKSYCPKTHHVSFAGFIHYLLEYNYPHLLKAVNQFLANKTSKIEYPESIYSPIEQRNDGHWTSFMLQCLPTNFNTKIDYIIKTETASQDSNQIFKLLFPGLANQPGFETHAISDSYNYTGNKAKQLTVKSDKIYRYLPENFKVALNFVHKYELEMFGYDFL